MRYAEGLCRADITFPKRPRDINHYREHVIKPLILAGLMSDGSTSRFDDRKMRYDSASIDRCQGSLVLAFGHSNYAEYKEPFNHIELGVPELNPALVQLGIKRFNDPYAFFARAPGVQAVPITSDGAVILGVRTIAIEEGKTDQYQGALNGISGHLDFRPNPCDVRLEEDVAREGAELGINPDDINKVMLCGIASNPRLCGSDLDFVHLISVRQPSEYFTSGKYKINVPKKEKEHGEVIRIPTFSELQGLLGTGRISDGRRFEIIFSARASLESIQKGEMAS